jgi:peptidyl-tRNA hydrolase, PTH1 family
MLTERVIVGLGNPGRKYEMTRHNMGFLVVKAFADSLGWSFKDETVFCAYIAKGKIDDIVVHLVLPTTYMNESGRAVRKYADFYKLSNENVVVVNDDVALEFGQTRMRIDGSSGGHNGLKSIENHLGTRHYVRLRMGIGRSNDSDEALSDYVLDTFSKDELIGLNEFIDRGVKALRRLMKESITLVMNDINTKK